MTNCNSISPITLQNCKDLLNQSNSESENGSETKEKMQNTKKTYLTPSKHSETEIKWQESPAYNLDFQGMDIPAEYPLNHQHQTIYKSLSPYNTEKTMQSRNRSVTTGKRQYQLLKILREVHTGFIGIRFVFFIAYIIAGSVTPATLSSLLLLEAVLAHFDRSFHVMFLNAISSFILFVVLLVGTSTSVPGLIELRKNGIARNIGISDIPISLLCCFLCIRIFMQIRLLKNSVREFKRYSPFLNWIVKSMTGPGPFGAAERICEYQKQMPSPSSSLYTKKNIRSH